MNTENPQIGPAGGKDRKGFRILPAALVPLSILAGLSAATQTYALLFDYQHQLGANIGRVYAPWAVVQWAAWWPQYQQQTVIAAAIGLSVYLLFASIAVAALRLTANKEEPGQYLHGSARWATDDEIKTSGLLGSRGVFIGAYVDAKGRTHYLRHDGPEHCLCVAPPRSGKFVALVGPSLLDWRESTIANDIKGELYAVTAGFRATLGRVIRFDPARRGSAKWNPLEEIRIGTDHETGDAQNVAMLVVDPDGKGIDGDHWREWGFALLTGLILHGLKTGAGSLAAIDAMLATPNPGGLWRDMARSANSVVARAGSTMVAKDGSDEASGIASTVQRFLAVYRDPVIAENTSASDFRIADLTNEVMSLYLVTSPEDQARLRPINRLLMSATIRALCADIGRKPHRLMMMLDEFASLGKLGVFQDAIAYLAGYGVKCFVVVQDMAQLYALYGRDESISSSCHVRMFFAPNKPETGEHVSKLCGVTTIVHRDVKRNRKSLGLHAGGNITESPQQIKRPLLTADEAMTLPGATKNAAGEIVKPGEMIISIAGRYPIRGVQPLYFTDPILSKRAAIPCP